MNPISIGSSTLEAEPGSRAAVKFVDSVPGVGPAPLNAPVPVIVSAPVVASAPSSTTLASVASSLPKTPVPDPHHGLATGPTATSAPSLVRPPSVAQAALALATALRDTDTSITNESLVTDIITAFIRAGPKPISTATLVTKSTETVTPAIKHDARPKGIESRLDQAIANVNESLLKLSAEQKRLENLVNENTHRTKTRLANMKRKIAELDEATSEIV